jgi:AcrR family transcriptional regulator
MSHPSDARPIKRSQKLLRDALIDLIEERGFDSITVGDITERAMVSRATFYRNYLDKYDLVEQIFNDASRPLFETVMEQNQIHPPEIWVKFFEYIGEYDRMYRALLGRNGSPWFVQKMRTSLMELMKQHEYNPNMHSNNPNRDPHLTEYIREMVSTLIVESIIWWLEQGKPYSARVMTERCAGMASAIFTETVSW